MNQQFVPIYLLLIFLLINLILFILSIWYSLALVPFVLYFSCQLLFIKVEEEEENTKETMHFGVVFFVFISFDFNFLHPNSGNIRHNKFDWIINDVMPRLMLSH